MPAIATSKFRIHNAEQFVESFDEAVATNMYFFVGEVATWNDPSAPAIDDTNPPTPTNSTSNVEYAPWVQMIAAKRIQSPEVIHAIERYNWTSGIVYDQYNDQDTNLLDDSFYVLTTDYNVYKCLDNNGGATVSAEPSGTGLIGTADGYLWKYMYSISTNDALKFLTNDYMPVNIDSGVTGIAVDGSIEVINIVAGGGTYDGVTTVTITGDGTGAVASAVIAGGVITSITVDNAGSGYTSASVVISDTNNGVGATASAVISPKGGHGANAIEELGGKFVMVNVRLDGNENNTVSVANDFRQVGLLRDPRLYDDSGVASGTNYRQTYRYTITAGFTGTFVSDETITDSLGNSATVVEWDATNRYLYTTLPQNSEFGLVAVTGGTSTAVGTIEAIDLPGMLPYSGDILYMENRTPISRSSDQIEDIKLIIEF
jgi:hypothetical protein